MSEDYYGRGHEAQRSSLHDSDYADLHREYSRAVDKLTEQMDRERKTLELRLERQEHAQLQMRGKATGDFALRKDFEQHLDDWDDHLTETREAFESVHVKQDQLLLIVKVMNAMVDRIVGRLEVLEVGDE